METMDKYFIKKYGNKAYTNIKNMILRKIKVIPFIANTDLEKGEYYNKYIAFIFEVAAGDYWGLDSLEIARNIRKTINDKVMNNMNVGRAKDVHKDAIQEIQKYIQGIYVEEGI